MPYQSFNEAEGASQSHTKLQALHLPSDLTGLSVLDLGCNEGFFCIEAKRRGASRVVGIDANEQAIQAARQRAPDIDFLCQSWKELPPEKFDIIIMLSALHYESRPVALLDNIASHLTGSGLLILECGVVRTPERSTVWTQRGMVVYHPTWNFLLDEYLRSFGVKLVDKSVNQSGDPVPRYVFHCRPRKPFVIFAQGPGDSGKTSLAHELTRSGGQRVSTDRILSSLESMRKPNTQLLELISKCRTENVQSKAEVTRRLVQAGLERDFADLIFDHLILDVALIVIEGYSLTPVVVERLSARLDGTAVIWTATNPHRTPTPFVTHSAAAPAAKGNSNELGPESQLLAAQRAKDDAEREASALRKKHQKLVRQHERLRKRRSVRVALKVSRAFRPAFQIARTIRRSSAPSDN